MREDHEVRISVREKLVKAQKNICAYCSKPIKGKAQVDHVIPVFHLDKNLGEANLVVCCRYCNFSKNDMFVFTNLYDKIIYPILDIPVIFQDKYIHDTKKIRKSY